MNKIEFEGELGRYCWDAWEVLHKNFTESLEARGLGKHNGALTTLVMSMSGHWTDFTKNTQDYTAKTLEKFKEQLTESEKTLLILAMAMVMYHYGIGGKPYGDINELEVKIPKFLLNLYNQGLYRNAREVALSVINKMFIFDSFYERPGFAGEPQKIQIQKALEGLPPQTAKDFLALADQVFSQTRP